MLAVGAVYRSVLLAPCYIQLIYFIRSNLAILLYLTLDAAHLGVLSAFWAAAFLTERMPRMVTIIMMIVMVTLTSVMMTGPDDHPLPPHLLRPVRLDDRIWLLSQAGGARVGQVRGSLILK